MNVVVLCKPSRQREAAAVYYENMQSVRLLREFIHKWGRSVKILCHFCPCPQTECVSSSVRLIAYCERMRAKGEIEIGNTNTA